MADSEYIPKPPYVPFGTFKGFIESFRESGLPDVIDRSLMRTMSGTIQSMLAAALRSMGFIDEANRPTERFRQYIKGAVEDQKSTLRDGLQDCYPVIFSHTTDLHRLTAGQFDTALRTKYGFTASTLDKAASFFLAACQECGIELGTHLLKRKATATRKRRDKNERQDTVVPEVTEAVASQPLIALPQKADKPLPYQLLDLLQEPDFVDEHKDAVWKLVQYLMERNKKNPQAE